MKNFWSWPIIILSLSAHSLYFFLVINTVYHNIISIYIFAVAYLLCIVALFFLRKLPSSGYTFMKISFISKTILIPWYIFNYIAGIFGVLGTIGFPLFIYITMIVFILDVMVLFITSLYSSIGIMRFYKENGIRGRGLIVATQWIFCLDIIVLLAVFIEARKTQKLKQTRQTSPGPMAT